MLALLAVGRIIRAKKPSEDSGLDGLDFAAELFGSWPVAPPPPPREARGGFGFDVAVAAGAVFGLVVVLRAAAGAAALCVPPEPLERLDGRAGWAPPSFAADAVVGAVRDAGMRTGFVGDLGCGFADVDAEAAAVGFLDSAEEGCAVLAVDEAAAGFLPVCVELGAGGFGLVESVAGFWAPRDTRGGLAARLLAFFTGSFFVADTSCLGEAVLVPGTRRAAGFVFASSLRAVGVLGPWDEDGDVVAGPGLLWAAVCPRDPVAMVVGLNGTAFGAPVARAGSLFPFALGVPEPAPFF